MDISNIKDEILTQVTVDVKKEINHEVIILDDDEEENLKIKKEDDANVNFEKIFLPEVLYESDSMETPFFDYNLYLNKQKKEGNIFRVSMLNTTEDSTEDNYNKNIYSDNQYKCVVQERNNYNYSEGGTHAYEGEEYVYSPLKANLNECDYGSNENTGDVEIDDDVQFVIDSESVKSSVKLVTSTKEVPKTDSKHIELIHHYGLNSFNEVEGKYTQTVVRSPVRRYTYKSKKWRQEQDDDENCKYKCPLCKKAKGFYTLDAVNNHLKFEHISVFRKNKINDTVVLL